MGEQVGAKICGGVAQLGEHLPCKQGVKSSNLSISTRVSYEAHLKPVGLSVTAFHAYAAS